MFLFSQAPEVSGQARPDVDIRRVGQRPRAHHRILFPEMLHALLETTLRISQKSDAERDLVALAWKEAGGKILRVD